MKPISHILLTLSVSTAALVPAVAQEKPAVSAASTAPVSPAFSSAVKADAILKVANAVADWQLANPYERADWDWTEGALWTGMMAHVQTTGEEKYHRALLKVSEDLDYQLGPRIDFADDHCVGQLHLWHYLRDELPKQIEPTQKLMDLWVDRPHDEELQWENHVHMREWAWCDSLYMAPPTLAMIYAATGEAKYLENVDELWWKSSDFLYDKESHLFWRDSKYFTREEANGEKVFWSRGNGWVFAGLCHVLQHMPADHPTRPKYLQQFKEMAAKLKSLQLEDGSWHAALLDPESFPVPESSGTAFFTYGFLWGINNGVLAEADFKPAAIRGWQRLVNNVHANGKLGYVQPIGENPKKVTYDQTAVYGVGGFLLAAHELHKHLILSSAKLATFTASNPGRQNRLNEVVSMDWKKATALVSGITPENAAVRDTVTGYFLPVQVLDDNADGSPDRLLFQSDFTPSEKRTFQLLACAGVMPQAEKSQLMARYVPERKDDFVWENDRIAFRAYGPKLAVEKARGGIDVWTKSVRYSIANAWYKLDNYHKDNGTGLDGYKVGDTLGCGGVGYLDADDKLYTSPVYSSHKVVEQGPLRLKFVLSYAPVEIGQAKITETRTFTMLAGEHHFTVSSAFKVEGDATGIRPVAGITTRDPKAKASFSNKDIVSYRDPVMSKDEGFINTFLISDGKTVREKKHFLKEMAEDLSQPVSFGAGAIWRKIEANQRTDLSLMLYRTSHAQNRPIKVDE
ncbi:glycoside hydrolase family 88 protein [Verrucomicrobiaceae bacterium 5K15]|uniref:Glycoside hydrolase family 88 protein n=1 Tax=Oceaniferula flava TaxID=2800421 RepID=A0AAE2VE43_9BACT|nr:glycoside hydrolase family 88 protein [Oceaniferula flavus]MBK1855359.1 glycoside hydrolase family 88 protein [Oceaniferula flavus]MBM1136665.1 glycoside hydrolase family 88 protein [Oceaniferula flavus]